MGRCSVLSQANEKRNWKIFVDFGNYLIRLVRPLYANCPIPNVEIDNEVFALESTTISVSINLFTWAHGKYARGAVKMHILIDLRGSIPEFILITDGKYHDSNVLDVINFYANTIYLMNKLLPIFSHLPLWCNAIYIVLRIGNVRQKVIYRRTLSFDSLLANCCGVRG